jgi:hypothetical protein
VVILHDPEDDREDGSEREPGVLLDGLDEDLLAAAGQIEGVADVRTEIAHGYPLLQLRATRRTWAFSQIEALCQARGIWILDALAGPAGVGVSVTVGVWVAVGAGGLAVGGAASRAPPQDAIENTPRISKHRAKRTGMILGIAR